MRIESIQASFPSRTMTNEDVATLILEESRATFDGDLQELRAMIDGLFERSGIISRRWLRQDEKPIDLIERAVVRSLEEAQRRPRDIDMVIHVGVDRRFSEPGQSHMLAKAFGMRTAHCLDILDACNSWSRATQIAQSLLCSGDYSRILIVNGEFNVRYGGIGLPQNTRVRNVNELEWLMPTYTIGEAATATILSADGPNWKYRTLADNDNADLCTVALAGYKDYAPPSELLSHGAGRFVSYGPRLAKAVKTNAPKALQMLDAPLDRVKTIVPHAFSKKVWDDMAEPLGIRAKLWNIYPHYGNTVSASVPAGITTAVAAGRIKRGDLVVAWTAAAGMSYGAYLFEY